MDIQEFIPKEHKYYKHFNLVGLLIGLLMVGLGLFSYIGYLVFDCEQLKPSDMNAGFLLSVGASIFLAVISPLLKSKEMNEKLEFASDELQKDLAQEIVDLKSEKTSNFDSEIQSNELKSLLIDFLSNWSKWGFNVQRISNWGSQQLGYENLSKYSNKEITGALIELIAEGKVKNRLSSKGTLLFQINRT